MVIRCFPNIAQPYKSYSDSQSQLSKSNLDNLESWWGCVVSVLLVYFDRTSSQLNWSQNSRFSSEGPGTRARVQMRLSAWTGQERDPSRRTGPGVVLMDQTHQGSAGD